MKFIMVTMNVTINMLNFKFSRIIKTYKSSFALVLFAKNQ